MKEHDLNGKTYRVVDADHYKLLLELDDGSGISTNEFVLIEAKSIATGVDHGTFKVSELKKS